MSSNEPTLDLRVPNFEAAITNFTHYIKHEAQLRYDMKSGPLEFRTRLLPLAPRRGEINETLYWSAEDGCWYNIDKQEIVLGENIWRTIMSVINRLGGDTRSHYVYNAVREKYYYISQKDVRVACMEWKRNNLSLLDKYDGTPTNDNILSSTSNPQRGEDVAAEETVGRAATRSTPTPNQANLHKTRFSKVTKSLSRGRTLSRRTSSHRTSSRRGSRQSRVSAASTAHNTPPANSKLAAMLKGLKDMERGTNIAVARALRAMTEAQTVRGEAEVAVREAEANLVGTKQKALAVIRQCIKEKDEVIDIMKQARENSQELDEW